MLNVRQNGDALAVGIALVGVLFFSKGATAGSPPLLFTVKPHTASWCAAVMTSHQQLSPEQGAMLTSLRDSQFKTRDALKVVQRERQNVGKIIQDKVAHFIPFMAPFVSDRLNTSSTEVNLVTLDLRQHGQLASVRKEEFLSSAASRLMRLEEEATELQPDTIVFGQEIRGRDAVRAYLEGIAGRAEAIDHSVQAEVDKKLPYFRKEELGRQGTAIIFPIGIAGGLTSIFVRGEMNPALIAMVLYTALSGVPRTMELVDYTLGAVVPGGRAAFENRHNGMRVGDQVKHIDRALQLLDDPKTTEQSIAYHGYTLTLPVDFVNEVLDASHVKRPVDATKLVSAIESQTAGMRGVDRRYMMVDQLLTFENGEPVVTNFVRIKKTFGGNKPQKKEEKQTKTIEQELGGFVPAGSGAR